jgi:hypothetical protein
MLRAAQPHVKPFPASTFGGASHHDGRLGSGAPTSHLDLAETEVSHSQR